MTTTLFETERLRLAPPDPEHDAEVESVWTHDSAYLRLLDAAPARPLSPAQVKKKYEALEKEHEKQFYFALRTREPEGPGRLLGFVQLKWIDWLHGGAELRLGIGAPADRGQGYGSEAAGLILHYAFDELGLHRLSAVTYEYNPGAVRFIERQGFQLEVRMRQAVQRDLRRWDALHYGLLRSEWEQHGATDSAEAEEANSMNDALLRGALVRLAAPNPETDAETIATWSRDSEFQHLLEMGVPRVWSARGVKADIAETQGDEKPRDEVFPFVIRNLADDQLIGFTDLEISNWSQRNAWIGIGIGPRDYWGKGYGTDAMRVLMRYAFMELNLERLTLNVFAYNERAQHSYLKVGFQVEGRQRERLRRGSQRYDMIFMGILRDEWRSREWRSREESAPEEQAQLPAGSN